MNQRQRKKQVTHGPWRRLVSARFLVHARTRATVSDHEMMALGIPPKRVQSLLENRPLLRA